MNSPLVLVSFRKPAVNANANERLKLKLYDSWELYQ
jgi:hypothetical protein